MKRPLLLALAGIFLATPARPDPPELKDWKPIRAQQPAGLAMRMTLPKTHFFQGEEIKATLVFSNTSDKPYHTWIGTYDRSGRILDIGFRAEERPVWQYIDKPKVHFPTPIGLDALPVKPIPELTDAFRHWLTVKDMDPDMVLPLLDRYGTDDLLSDVKRYYQPLAGHLSCYAEGACLRFWIRHEPETGMAELQKALHAREETRCYTMLLEYVLKGHWNALAEPMVVKDLGDLDADFVLTAIKILEDNGSAQAVEPVIATLERIHSTIPPKISDEEPLDIQRQQEAHLAHDLLASTRWTYTAAQKARLQKIAATAN